MSVHNMICRWVESAVVRSLYPEKGAVVPPVLEAGGALAPVWTGVEKRREAIRSRST
jgi:hypothetical protein